MIDGSRESPSPPPAPSSVEAEAEVELVHDGVTHVVRVDGTVRRPVRPFTATIQDYLAHLHARGFTDAPVPLGTDGQGREVLSFVPGDVPVEPLPADVAGLEVLAALGGLIRRLHDAAESWEPDAGAVFGSIPGVVPDGVVPMFDTPELVSHQDYCPGNVVFRGGLPVALIDFDLARPTTRGADVVNALGWWVPLRDPVDRGEALAGADAAVRVRAFADGYGMDGGLREQVVPLARRRAANLRLTMRAAAEADPVFRRWWDDGLAERLDRAEVWLSGEAARIERALLAPAA
ncbi:phosphotransferase enzyme family protein [Oerskovia flava]|uniref:phosphotransferase enzyme family protein n=1 Tax=Oerskovia flava TaxID=2986422 RepID=UPI00223FDECA|nr:phosphotransferase [Oerskovia sp. JB1-3-2]